jgi:hypothetical protein
MTKKKVKEKLPSIAKKESGVFQIRLSNEERLRALEARQVLMRPIGQMFREALFNYYLPYHYGQLKESTQSDHE